MSPELEQTLALLSPHRSVLGYFLLSRGDQLEVSIIPHSGAVFEGEQEKIYVGVIRRIVERAGRTGGGQWRRVRRRASHSSLVLFGFAPVQQGVWGRAWCGTCYGRAMIVDQRRACTLLGDSLSASRKRKVAEDDGPDDGFG